MVGAGHGSMPPTLRKPRRPTTRRIVSPAISRRERLIGFMSVDTRRLGDSAEGPRSNFVVRRRDENEIRAIRSGLEVVDFSSPVLSKDSNVRSAQTCLQQGKRAFSKDCAMKPVRSNPVRWLMSKNRGTRPFAVGDRSGWPGC